MGNIIFLIIINFIIIANMNIFCLVRSLTAGYPRYSPDRESNSNGEDDSNIQSQYQYWLEKLIKDFLDDNSSQLRIFNKGNPKDISSDLLKRIDRDIFQALWTPDYCIIITGTDDLFSEIPLAEILKNIKTLHALCEENDIISIGATIPPVRYEQEKQSYKKHRKKLNQQLVSYFSQKKVPYTDLYEEMMDDTGNLPEKYAAYDGIHFSVKGYKKMGKLLFLQAIKQLL